MFVISGLLNRKNSCGYTNKIYKSTCKSCHFSDQKSNFGYYLYMVVLNTYINLLPNIIRGRLSNMRLYQVNVLDMRFCEWENPTFTTCSNGNATFKMNTIFKIRIWKQILVWITELLFCSVFFLCILIRFILFVSSVTVHIIY